MTRDKVDNGGTLLATVAISEDEWRKIWGAVTPMGINLGKEIGQEPRILPADFRGEVFYDERYKGLASYQPRFNSIKVGNQADKYGAGVLTAVLRHEKSHAIMANLTADNQTELIDTLWENDPELLNSFYRSIRECYAEDYFDEAMAAKLQLIAVETERGYHQPRMEYVWNGERLELVNLTLLIDELIAFRVVRGSGDEFLPEAETWHRVANAANETTSWLSEASKGMIESMGFFEVNAADLLAQLNQDPDFINSRIRLN